MKDTVIKVENLSKVYRLGTIGTGSLRQDLQQLWNKKILKKQDPFFALSDEEANKSKDLLWALKDINFEVKQGEALGIIGSNGSGKSTLLKIISRIVKPTKGIVKGRGKISSLLEVGTGFHHELSGRENIYNSGYTLGMTKAEITEKFDEIVEFSGVERFIDTPVKRYSSGMYVRLAFSVAAHLEPDILIVDEVLAVGDADFQLKCMGKMQEVSAQDGRTIIFVSHNTQAIASLCNRAIWLEKGKIKENDSAQAVVQSYLSASQKNITQASWSNPADAPGNDYIRMKSLRIKANSSTGSKLITVDTPVKFDVNFWNFSINNVLRVSVRVYAITGEHVFDVRSETIPAKNGLVSFSCEIPAHLLNNTSYSITLLFLNQNDTSLFEYWECAMFKVEDICGSTNQYGQWPGALRPNIKTHLNYKEVVQKTYPLPSISSTSLINKEII